MVVLVGVIFVARPSAAEKLPQDRAADCLPAGSTGIVDHAIDGRTLALNDGRTIRLAAIGTPVSALGHAAEMPLARSSREALDRLAMGEQITLRGPTDQDRYGRYVAEVTRRDGMWLEGELLRIGRAWVETSLDHRELAASMLMLEAAARDAHLGLWQSRYYTPRDVADVTHTDDSFAIIEGRIEDVRTAHDIVTVKFTEGDLELRIDRAAHRRLAAEGLMIEALVGSKIRVRGWPYWAGRPVLDLSYPEQLERMGGDTSPALSHACS